MLPVGLPTPGSLQLKGFLSQGLYPHPCVELTAQDGSLHVFNCYLNPFMLLAPTTSSDSEF